MPCRYHVDDEWCEPVRVTPGQRLGRSVAVVGSEATFGRVVLLALIVQRRDDRGNPDLAVAAVEVGIWRRLCSVAFDAFMIALRSVLALP